ncbi:probable galacturonosyltransferase 7 isoform X2 [Tanacetum coccineum]
MVSLGRLLPHARCLRKQVIHIGVIVGYVIDGCVLLTLLVETCSIMGCNQWKRCRPSAERSKELRGGLKSIDLDELCRELQTALGTTKCEKILSREVEDNVNKRVSERVDESSWSHLSCRKKDDIAFEKQSVFFAFEPVLKEWPVFRVCIKEFNDYLDKCTLVLSAVEKERVVLSESWWFYHLCLLDQTVKVDMPTLVSSWPPHGSDINQVTLPVFFNFDEPIEGDDTSDYLSIRHDEVNSSKNVQVKDSMEMSDSIISLSDVTSSRPGLLDLLNYVLSEFLLALRKNTTDTVAIAGTPPHDVIDTISQTFVTATATQKNETADDNIETFQVQEFVLSPLLKQYSVYRVVGACHGLLCLFGFHIGHQKYMVVIWNPSIRKSFGICTAPLFGIDIGFGVCPVTKDPTFVKIKCKIGMPWHVEVFTLSSRVWNVIPCSKLPRESIKPDTSTQVVIDTFIYWGACENTFADDGEATTNHMVVSFDLVTKEFKVVDLPDSLTKELWSCCSVSKLRGSLVVFGYIEVEEAIHFCAWVMEHDSSFRKLFTIGAPVDEIDKILGFKKNGETIFETRKNDIRFTTLDVYDPCSQQIKNLGISGASSFFMGSYKESLLLLDHSDLYI